MFRLMKNGLLLATLIFYAALALSKDAEPDHKLMKISIVPEKSARYVWLYGETNTINYTSVASDIEIKSENSFPSPKAGDWNYVLQHPILSDFFVRIGVDGLKSNVGGLDGNMHKTLRSDQHPDITFRLSSYKSMRGATEGEFIIAAYGLLTIAGKEKSTDLQIKASLSGQHLHIEGTKKLKMSDFGITPPVTKILFVTLTAKDEILVSFDLDLLLEAKVIP